MRKSVIIGAALVILASTAGCFIEDRPVPPPKPEKTGGSLPSDRAVNAEFNPAPIQPVNQTTH